MSRELRPLEPSIDSEYDTARGIVNAAALPSMQQSTAVMVAGAILAAGAMIARAIYQLDYTLRTR